MCGDIMISSEYGYLNEVPMAEYLDTYTSGENPAVISYRFNSKALNNVLSPNDSRFVSKVTDSSNFNSFNVKIYGVDQNYLESSYPEFYVPTEVDG